MMRREPEPLVQKHSAETRAKMRAGALKRGTQRSRTIGRKLLIGMRAIRKELKENTWVHSKGLHDLDLAELCRRANVNHTTLYPKKDDAKSGNQIQVERRARMMRRCKLWISRVNRRRQEVVRNTRRSLASRIADWKEMYEGLVTSNRITELELDQTVTDLGRVTEQLAKANETISALNQEVARLTGIVASYAGQNVVPLKSQSKKP